MTRVPKNNSNALNILTHTANYLTSPGPPKIQFKIGKHSKVLKTSIREWQRIVRVTQYAPLTALALIESVRFLITSLYHMLLVID